MPCVSGCCSFVSTQSSYFQILKETARTHF